MNGMMGILQNQQAPYLYHSECFDANFRVTVTDVKKMCILQSPIIGKNENGQNQKVAYTFINFKAVK